MATFGSYGNLGGELVSVVEINQNLAGTIGTTTSYTCPAQRYALVVIRNLFIGYTGGFGGSGSILFNFGTGNTFSYNSATETRNISFSINHPSAQATTNVNDNFDPKLMNEGETIQHLLNNNSMQYNFLIFEYRKP